MAEDCQQATAEQVRFDAHVGQASDRLRAAARVERRQNQVAGQGRLEHRLRSFPITDFTHHDNIRVLSDYGS